MVIVLEAMTRSTTLYLLAFVARQPLQGVEVFMNGGTVTREERVYDQGRGSVSLR